MVDPKFNHSNWSLTSSSTLRGTKGVQF